MKLELSDAAIRRIAQKVSDQFEHSLTENQERWVEEGKGYIDIVNIDELIPTEWQEEQITPIVQKKLDEMSEHIQTPGMRFPLIETYFGEDGQLYIADGHHRFFMYKQLGIEQIPVFISK